MANIIRELSTNLTGGQIQKVLDTLLFKAIEPLILHTSLIEETLPKILINVINDRRRKISALPFDMSVSMLIDSIVTSSLTRRLQLVSQLKIERNIWSKILIDFLSGKSDYQELYITNSKDKIEKVNKKYKCNNLWEVFNDVEYYFSQYSKFRGMILGQYIQQSHKYAHEIGDDDNVSHQDLHQLLLVAVSKGIDKYDSSSGALSSYLNFWQMNVKSSMYDLFTNNSIAYDVPNSYKQKIAEKKVGGNWSHNIIYEGNDDEEPFTEDEKIVEDSAKIRLLKIIRVGDINGIYRLANNIDEVRSFD
jgi:hypothetical protein